MEVVSGRDHEFDGFNARRADPRKGFIEAFLDLPGELDGERALLVPLALLKKLQSSTAFRFEEKDLVGLQVLGDVLEIDMQQADRDERFVAAVEVWQFLAQDVVAGEELGADEQQAEVAGGDRLLDFLVPPLAGR